jgi:hypothetical protein
MTRTPRDSGKYCIISVSPASFVNMDFASIRSRIRDHLSEKKLHIALEFTSGSYLYSRVAAFLVESYRVIMDQGGTLALICADPHFLEVLRTAQLDRVVRMVSSREHL